LAVDLHIQTATPADAEALASLMRTQDVEELEACGLAPLEALSIALAVSDVAYTAFVDGEVAAMWGAHGWTVGGWGVPWLLTGRAIARHPKVLLKHSHRCLQELTALYPTLFQFIDARYTGAVRWARWLGFQVFAAQPFGSEGLPFHPVVYRRKV
jgi:hypothetical protein